MSVFTLRVVTLNIFGVPFVGNTRARLAAMARALNASDLDVICLQEVQLSRYVPLLRDALSNYAHAAYEPHLYAPKGGLLTLARSVIHDARFILYHKRGHWHTPAVADRMLAKGLLVSELRAPHLPVYVVNTHLVANYDADWSRHNRYARHQDAEVKQLLDALDALPHHALVVVCGDFNFPRGSWLYRELVTGAHLHDPLAENHEPTLRPRRYLPARHAQPIDHLLIRAPRGQRVDASAHLVFRERVRLANGNHAYVSDHIGIQATLRVHPSS